MYYESYERRNRRRGGRRRYDRYDRRRSGGCAGILIGRLLKLIAFLLALALLAAVLLYIIPPAFLNTEKSNADLALTDGLPSNRVNILLLGLDELHESSQRSDTMIIASVGYKSLKLVSVMRDTMVDIPGFGKGKLNSAYSCGGAEAVVHCINDTFGLNITRYIAVDYASLVRIVDAVDGIDISISDAELTQMNRNVANSARVFKPLGYDAQPMTQSGSVHLNGLFALGYARIRKIDSDYMRTYRQRKVLSAICSQAVKRLWDPRLYANLIDVYKSSVETNLSLVELISLGEKMLVSSGGIEESRTPQDAFAADNGSSITINDRIGNISALHGFIYG